MMKILLFIPVASIILGVAPLAFAEPRADLPPLPASHPTQADELANINSQNAILRARVEQGKLLNELKGLPGGLDMSGSGHSDNALAIPGFAQRRPAVSLLGVAGVGSSFSATIMENGQERTVVVGNTVSLDGKSWVVTKINSAGVSLASGKKTRILLLGE